MSTSGGAKTANQKQLFCIWRTDHLLRHLRGPSPSLLLCCPHPLGGPSEILPRTDSCQCCRGWAWFQWSAAPQCSSSCNDLQTLLGLWRDRGGQNDLTKKRHDVTCMHHWHDLCHCVDFYIYAFLFKFGGCTNTSPDLPMRWRYVSALLGKSKLMTTFTAWMSIPRVNRSTRKENVKEVNVLLSAATTWQTLHFKKKYIFIVQSY